MSAEKSRNNKINVGQINTTEFRRNNWMATPEYGTEFDDLLRPSYWAHVAGRLRPFDIIECVFQEGTYYARLLVTQANSTGAKVVALDKVRMGSVVESTDEVEDEFVTKWGGPHAKWRVIRTADKKVVKENLESQEEALRELRDYVKALAA